MGEILPSMVLELFRDFSDKLNSRASCPLRIYAAKTLNGIMIVCWGSANNIFMAQNCSEFSSEGFRDFCLCVPGLCLRKQHAKQERPQGFRISGSRFGIRGVGEATERVVACWLAAARALRRGTHELNMARLDITDTTRPTCDNER